MSPLPLQPAKVLSPDRTHDPKPITREAGHASRPIDVLFQVFPLAIIYVGEMEIRSVEKFVPKPSWLLSNAYARLLEKFSRTRSVALSNSFLKSGRHQSPPSTRIELHLLRRKGIVARFFSSIIRIKFRIIRRKFRPR